MPSRPVRDAWLLPTLELLLSEEKLARLREIVEESYWEAAVRDGLAADDEILAALASRFRMKLATLAALDPHARELVPESVARRYRVCPVHVTDSHLEVATSDPTDMDSEQALAFASGRSVRMTLASPFRIAEAVEELYQPEKNATSAIARILENVADKYDVQALSDESEAMDIGAGLDAAHDRPVIKLVDYLIAEGITTRASDIHLEPEETGLAVRYRIDGVLRQVLTLPRPAGIPLVSRIKIMSGLDIADRLRPQDGRARVAVNGKQVDLRVSTLPAAHGEKVVIRILDGAGTVMAFEQMGMHAYEHERLQRLLATREGVILVTGPTGSGKTTTLYTALRQIQQRGGTNIVTVEDPVEYRLPGIVQVQVNERAGLTFAAALRSILRQDPDVVLVGEIRDRETAQIAVQASLTGHLVFSTLHTIDAASSVTRLADIGIESYKIAGALKGIVAQRLLRRLCRSCRRPAVEPAAEAVRTWFPEGLELWEAVGCPECSNTGYRGRVAVLEIIIVDAEVERRIAAGAPLLDVIEAARQNGMRSLWESGVEHVRGGTTSLDELCRVLDMPSEPSNPASRPVQRAPRRAMPTPLMLGTVPPAPAVPAVPPASARMGDNTVLFPPGVFQLVDEPDPHQAAIAEVSTVLLVEDEHKLRGVLRDLLEREGYAVLEARDGVEALEQIDRGAPDLVVLDLTLPRIDGYTVLGRVRTRRHTQALPVIVLTAREDEDAEVRTFELGADDFLSKPFRPRALLARIRSLLRRQLAAPAASPNGAEEPAA